MSRIGIEKYSIDNTIKGADNVGVFYIKTKSNEFMLKVIDEAVNGIILTSCEEI